MNTIYFAVALITLVGASLVNGQCDKGPKEWKRPEECCKFDLFKKGVFDDCKGEKPDHPNKGKPPKNEQNKPGKKIKGNCHIECAFNKTGLYNGKDLNENQIREYFTAAVNGNDGLTKAVNGALGTCLPLAKSHSAEFSAKKPKGEKCNPATGYLFMCVTTNIVAKCPAADFKSNDATCVALQEYYNQCPNGPQ